MTPAARHLCWSYDDPRPFDAYAREYLLAGLAAGEKVWFVPGARSALAGDLPQAVRVIPPAEAYPGGQVIDPAGQVAAYAAVTEGALAAGFTGFRVVADVSPLVRTPEQRDAFARYEYVVGRYISSSAMRAVCGYDRLELGNSAVAELASLHEASHDAGATFQLHPGATTTAATLAGELDVSAEEVFTTALRHTDLGPSGGEVTLDADRLRFIDHRALLALQRFAAPRRITAVLRTGPGSATRLAGLLDLPNVRVEAAR